MFLVSDMLRKHRVYAPEDGTGTGGGEGGEGGENTADDTAGDETPAGDDTDTDDGIVLGGDTAEGDDTPGESDGDDSKDDDADGKENDAESEDESEGAPDEYDFTDVLPEGFEIDAALLEAVTPAMRELNLTQKQANTLTAAYAEARKAEAEASVQAVKDTLSGWKADAKADKEIGGGNWDASVQVGNAVIRQFGTPELIKDVLVGQGIGNHPEMIRFMSRVGKAVGDDTLNTGEQTDTSDAVPQEQRWYGNTTPTTKKG
jgi:hypothetical protein